MKILESTILFFFIVLGSVLQFVQGDYPGFKWDAQLAAADHLSVFERRVSLKESLSSV